MMKQLRMWTDSCNFLYTLENKSNSLSLLNNDMPFNQVLNYKIKVTLHLLLSINKIHVPNILNKKHDSPIYLCNKKKILPIIR